MRKHPSRLDTSYQLEQFIEFIHGLEKREQMLDRCCGKPTGNAPACECIDLPALPIISDNPSTYYRTFAAYTQAKVHYAFVEVTHSQCVWCRSDCYAGIYEDNVAQCWFCNGVFAWRVLA